MAVIKKKTVDNGAASLFTGQGQGYTLASAAVHFMGHIDLTLNHFIMSFTESIKMSSDKCNTSVFGGCLRYHGQFPNPSKARRQMTTHTHIHP